MLGYEVKETFKMCPTIFRKYTQVDSLESEIPIYVQKGWIPIIHYLCLELEANVKEISTNLIKDDCLPYLDNVEQNFTDLRVEVKHGTEEINELIKHYCWLATRICQHCAKFGAKPRFSAGVSNVLCDKCVNLEVDNF